MKVRFEPGTGYEHRFTKPVKEFLSRQILGHADDIREAAAFVDTHRNMTVHVVWDEEGPSHNSLRESAIYWVEVDYAVTIRFAIGAFEEFEDTHDNQALIGTFRIKGITDAYSSISRRARKQTDARISNPGKLLTLMTDGRETSCTAGPAASSQAGS